MCNSCSIFYSVPLDFIVVMTSLIFTFYRLVSIQTGFVTLCLILCINYCNNIMIIHQ